MHVARRIALATVCMVSLFAGSAAAQDAVPVCATLTFGTGAGAPRVELKLIADVQAAFFELAGKARFTQAVAPPAGLIIYAVSGTAIHNADGIWVSLGGSGYDEAKTIFRATIAGQLSLDPAKNRVAYVRQNLDGSSPVTLNGVPQITACP
jgi:hypothetical protein